MTKFTHAWDRIIPSKLILTVFKNDDEGGWPWRRHLIVTVSEEEGTLPSPAHLSSNLALSEEGGPGTSLLRMGNRKSRKGPCV